MDGNKFNDNNINDLSLDDMEELFKDVIEMPAPLIGTICCWGGMGGKIYGGDRG